MKSLKILLLVSISVLLKLSKAKETVFSVYGECNDVPNSVEDNNLFCSTIYPSQKCQDYYNNPEQFLKIVDETYDDIEVAAVKYHKEKAKVVCQRDEANTICPIGQYYIDNASSNVKENDYIAQSCHSTLCIQATQSYIEAQKEYYILKYPNKKNTFINLYNERIELLKCINADTARFVTSNGNDQLSNHKENNGDNDATSNSSNSENIVGDGSDTIGIDDNNEIFNDTIQFNFSESLSTNEKIIFLVIFILINILFL